MSDFNPLASVISRYGAAFPSAIVGAPGPKSPKLHTAPFLNSFSSDVEKCVLNFSSINARKVSRSGSFVSRSAKTRCASCAQSRVTPSRESK